MTSRREATTGFVKRVIPTASEPCCTDGNPLIVAALREGRTIFRAVTPSAVADR